MVHPLSMNEDYTCIHREKRRRGVMNQTSTVEKVALVYSSTRGGCDSFTGHSRGGRFSNSPDDKGWLKCEHCGWSKHTKDQCWDLHVQPPDLNLRPFQRGGSGSGRGGDCFSGNQPNTHLVTSSSIELPFISPLYMPPASPDGRGLSSDEITAFRCFVSQVDYTSTTPTSSFAHSDISASSLFASITTPQCSWIIDFGASHHMISMSSLFTSYHIFYGKDKVRIVDGSLSFIVSQRDISATSYLCLSSVLHVRNFTLNLLSISYIIKNLNCCVTFFLTHCVFQDMVTKKMIGSGHENDGFYILNSNPPVTTSTIKKNISHSTVDELFTWHYRLDHLSFSILRKMFPHISFSKFNVHCEPC